MRILTINDIITEGIREYNVCIACRFCIGYCPVWDALDNVFFKLKRESVDRGDLLPFAYLCHDCRNCYYACPYKPPHELSVNIPRVNSQVRLIIDEEYVRPRFMAKVFRHQYAYGTGLFALFLTLAITYVILSGHAHTLVKPIASIYEVMPSDLIDIIGITLGIWGLGVLTYEGLLYWRGLGGSYGDLLNARANLRALRDAFLHMWFRGGGEGCDYPGEYGTLMRFYGHVSLFLGMIIDFIATLVAAYEQDIARLYPFYPIVSAPPVILGVLGGALIVIGTALLLVLKSLSNKELMDSAWLEIDEFMLYLLMLIAVTGFAILALRHYAFEGLIFIIHISLVATLFTITPHSKLTHIIYRYIALLRYYKQ